MACLDDQTVLDMVEGRLPVERRRLAIEHADGCSSCRELIASVTAALNPDPIVNGLEPTGPALPSTGALAPGSQVGRYRILDLVGAGGMGVVYAAYDPDLDRRVALKLVRGAAGPDAESQRARLQREARAIARVAHPHVVAVHDVGAIGDQVFIAMEFVEGTTLSSWLASAPRSLDERLEVLAQAGRGLGAAHRAGLVHRDFKPDNVLVGKDGRVRVTDFGLARPPGVDLTAERDHDVDASPDQPLTQSGAFVGTPAYMAPEQMRGETIDPRADVFSFSVAAWECLYGARPFSGSTADELRRAITDGTVGGSTAAGDAPARMRRALLGGLRADPAARPSLQALLDELAPIAPARHRLAWWAAAATVAAVALSLVGALVYTRKHELALCQAGGARLAGVWDAARKQSLTQALAGGDPDTAHALTSALDHYAGQWSARRRDACEATHVRGEQSTATLDLRMECLEQRRRELDAFVTQVAASPQHLTRAALRVYQLVPISECDDVAALRSVLRPSLPAPALEALHLRLAHLRANKFVEDSKAEAAEAEALAEEATRVGALDVVAGALAVEGATREAEDDHPGAHLKREEAAVVAGLAHDDLTLVHILTAMAILEGVIGSNFAEANRLISYARAVVARLGGYPRAEWELLDAIGQVEWRSGRLADSEEHHRQAIAWYERSGESNPLDYAGLLLDLADALGDAGRFDEARPLYQRALELNRQALGPFHPQVLQNVINMSVDAYEGGHPAEAIRMAENVVTLFEHHPQDRMGNANALNSLGWFVSATDPKRAESLFRRSLEIYTDALGPDALDLSYPLTGLGIVELQLGRRKEALPTLERALALQAQPELRETPDRAETELALARALEPGPRALALARHARDNLKAHPLGPRRAQLVIAADQLLRGHDLP